MLNINAATNMGNAGLVQAFIRRMQKKGEETSELRDARIQKASEKLVDEVPKIIYSSKGDIINPHEQSKYLDFFVWIEQEHEEEKYLDTFGGF